MLRSRRRARFDALFSDRHPVEYVERAVVCLKDDCLVAISEKGGILSLPSSNVSLLFLGPGTSISHEALIRCAENSMNVAVVRAGTNIHSYFLAGRWPNPDIGIRQANVLSDKNEKTRIANIMLKKLYEKRGRKIEKIPKTISEILGVEAALFKKEYADLSKKNGFTWEKRQKKSLGGVNGYFSLLNKLLYSYSTGVILTAGLNPSIGVIHGAKRKGALAFDLADQFKLNLCTETVLENLESSSSELIKIFNEKILINKNQVTKQMFDFCDWLVSGAKEEDWPL